MTSVIWLVVMLTLIRPVAMLHTEMYTQYVADSGMYYSGLDGSPAIELDYEEYYKPRPTTARTSSHRLVVSDSIGQISNDNEKIANMLSFYGQTLFVLFFAASIIFLFAVLYYINSDYYRRKHTNSFRSIEMVLDNGLDSIAVINLKTNQTTITKFLPRDVDGHVLPVLREESQE